MRLIIALVLLMPLMAYSQKKQGQALVDSLLAELPKIKEDSNGVWLLQKISSGYKKINPKEGIRYAEQELALARKIEWKRGQALAYNDLGNSYSNKGDLPASLDAYFKALHIEEELGNNHGVSIVTGNIGGIYDGLGEYTKALEYLHKALKMAEAEHDKPRELVVLGNIGIVYNSLGKDTEALEFQKRSLRIAEELGDKQNIINQIGNIGNTYSNLGQYNSALVYSYRALRLAQQFGDRQGLATNAGNIGLAYLQIAKAVTLPTADSLVPSGKAANLTMAINYLRQGINLCKESHLTEAVPEFSKYLSDAYEFKGDHKAALQAYKEYVTVKDSLFSTENTNKIASLETERAIELKDKDLQIARLAVAKRRNERGFFVAGIVMLLLTVGILFRSYKKNSSAPAIF